MKLLRDLAVRHLLTLEPEGSIRLAAKVMKSRDVGSAVVIDSQGDVAGIVTERDVLHAVADGLDLEKTQVAEIMTPDVVSGQLGWDLMRAVRTMIDGGFRHLLVMEGNDPVGIVSLRDLMDSMAELIQAESASH
jgi:signal-transduction protein with cAMP-binding, CBS, and nucleotidyltransferase domain